MDIFSKTIVPVLEKSLSAYSLRQKVIADNIANIETPGYSKKAVTFEEQLSQAIDNTGSGTVSTNPRHIPIGSAVSLDNVEPQIVSAESSHGDPLMSGVNGVDVDSEMVDLAKNQIRYRMAARMMATVFQQIQKAVRGTA